MSAAVPTLEPGHCQVWWATPEMAVPGHWALLDGHERRWAQVLRRSRDRERYVVAHALARRLAAAHASIAPERVRFSRACRRCGAEHGKPRAVGEAGGLELSLSHSGDRVVVAIARAVAIGVDVERVDAEKVSDGLIASALDTAERRELERLPRPSRVPGFLRYWSRKEAVLKATGDGLAVAPAAIRVSSPLQPPCVLRGQQALRDAWPIRMHDLDAGAGHVAALASVGAPLAVRNHDAAYLLRRTANREQETS